MTTSFTKAPTRSHKFQFQSSKNNKTMHIELPPQPNISQSCATNPAVPYCYLECLDPKYAREEMIRILSCFFCVLMIAFIPIIIRTKHQEFQEIQTSRRNLGEWGQPANPATRAVLEHFAKTSKARRDKELGRLCKRFGVGYPVYNAEDDEDSEDEGETL